MSFDANGGTGTKAAVEGVSGTYTLPDATGLTAPEGKVFAGWALTINFAAGEESISLKKGETHAYQYEIQPRGATVNKMVITSCLISK